jgi:hypothetical protein
MWRCDVTHETLSAPRTRASARTGAKFCQDGDGLESGNREAFRGTVEPGGPATWEKAVSGKWQEAADQSEPQVLELHE